MKGSLLTLFFSVWGYSLLAQNTITDTSATCIAYWKNKEEKVFIVNHIKERRDSNIVKSRLDYTYEAHIAIKDSTEDGYTIEWKNENYGSATNDPNVEMMNRYFKDLKFIYKTEVDGSFAELLNWEEVRDFYVNMAALSIPKNNDTAQRIWKQTRELFATREAVEGMLIKEIQLFHAVYGLEYVTREQKEEALLPNMFGGDPIPAVLSVKITKLDKNLPIYTLRSTQSIDKGKAMGILDGFVKSVGIAVPKTDEEIRKVLSDFEIADEKETEIEISSGWLNKFFFQRTAKVFTTVQTESYSFKRKLE